MGMLDAVIFQDGTVVEPTKPITPCPYFYHLEQATGSYQTQLGNLSFVGAIKNFCKTNTSIMRVELDPGLVLLL